MKPRSFLLYILFFMVALLVFASLLFPGKKVAAYFSQSLKSDDLEISMENAKPVFPFTLKFEKTKIYIGREIEDREEKARDINQRRPIVPASFKVSFSPAAVFKQKKQIQFQSDLYQGSIKGHLRLNSIDPLLFSEGSAFMSGIKIRDFQYKTDLADIILGCELNGEYNGSNARVKPDVGHGTLLIQNFSAGLKESLFNRLSLPQVDFSQIKVEFIQDQQTITIEQCAARGSIINLNLKGRIEIVFPLQKSRLNLTGILLPNSPYLAKFSNYAAIRSVVKNIQKDGIKFNITGLLENPKIGI